ncbi:hypothetical protein [Actinomadura hibisca]|uniref:hypothetical protein n=1 Tax=Actinomadura hibisca TaxID=68565 RepID=UPI000ACF500A|nr:hypothetical protein [Actinomadura hibisca]
MTIPCTRLPDTPLPDRAVSYVPTGRRLSPWPAHTCPSCAGPLDGGPVRFRCPSCNRGLPAADLTYETAASREAR